MNEIEEINFEDWFKDVETINEIPPIPKDFKGMFKNAETITELPPIPKDFNTEHLQEFIDEFEKTD